MRVTTVLSATAAVVALASCENAFAQGPVPQPPTGWTFNVLTFWHIPGRVNSKREPYGVFTSRDECEIARAKKTLELDKGNYRQPHLMTNAAVYTTTLTNGAQSITTQAPGGPTETMFITDCRDEVR